MRRTGVILTVLALAGAALGWLVWPMLAGEVAPIRVALLHSMTGTMAVSERAMVDAEVLALEEINARGGLLGRKVSWEIVDGKSDPAEFASQAERLTRDPAVSVIVGCYTSASRKAVKPVVERANHLLIYPVMYEGMEQSPRIVYTGATANQQFVPAVNWCHRQLKARRFALVGNDYVFPRASFEVVKDQIKALGGEVASEEYVPYGGTDLDAAVEKTLASKPDVVLSTLVGDSNAPFYKKIRGKGGAPESLPIVSFTVTEEELRELPVREMVNDYSVCNYLQGIDRPRNAEFVKAYRARYGDDRVTGDTVETAYNSVRLWAQAVAEAESALPTEYLPQLLRQSLDAPEGITSIDRETQHAWRPFFVGRVQSDGRVEVVYSVKKPIRPRPYTFSRTRREWDAFLEQLRDGWDGKWQAPAASRGSRTAAASR